MARDCEREHGEETSTISRRRYLQATGASAASLLAINGVGTAQQDFRTIEVDAGEVRRITLNDGETLENTLIDITADEAGYQIVAYGDGWTIRNVGVNGYFNADVDDPIVVQCPNGGTGTIENVYLGDGGYNAPAGKTTGVFVHANHSGHIDIDRVNVQGWAGNGVYASAPGNHDDHPAPGGGGTVVVTNSYGADNPTADFRLGTDGSYCQNCVTEGAGRGYWGFYHTTELRNCDIHNGVYASDGNWQAPAEVHLEDTRASGTMHTYASDAEIVGSSAGQPRDRMPAGVPTTAAEAASGATDDRSDDTTTTDPSDGESGTVLELISKPDTESITYEFTVEGSARKRTSAADDSPVAEGGDTVTDNGDGTVTVSGIAGNGYGDAFYVEGSITSMDLNEDNWTLRYGGEEITVAELTADGSDDAEQLPNTLLIDGGDSPNRASTYEFSVSGSVRKSAELGSINEYDEVTDGTITGRVIGGTDGYRFSGEITAFSLDGPATVRVENGEN